MVETLRKHNQHCSATSDANLGKSMKLQSAVQFAGPYKSTKPLAGSPLASLQHTHTQNGE
jgi:hypothetical protein